MPFVYNQQLFFTYSVHPHKVLALQPNGSATLAFETSNDTLFAHLENVHVHGGPPMVLVTKEQSTRYNDDYYLGVLHYFNRINAGPAWYHHHFFRAEGRPPFRILEVSSELPLKCVADLPQDFMYAQLVSYISGLQLQDDGQLLVSYGASDYRSRLITMGLQEAEHMFQGTLPRVPHLPRGGLQQLRSKLCV